MIPFVQGVLDVLMVQGGTLREGEEDIPPAGNLLAYRQSLSEDHTFLKVLGNTTGRQCIPRYMYCRSGSFVVKLAQTLK